MVEAEILTALISGSPTLAGGRIYAMFLPDGVTIPAITYQRVGTESINSFAGSSELDHVRMQIDCWASGYAEAKAMAAEVRQRMQGSGFKALLSNEFDDFEPDTERYRVSGDYLVWQKS